MKARPARVVAVATAFLLASASAASAAFVGLPANGAQVNDDPAAGIVPAQSAGVSDVAGGSLAGAMRVPWATFEQQAGSAQLIFVRAFQNGAWVTQGQALNIDRNVEAEAPSIDFAGAKRTVPWDAWYEPNAALGGQTQIFASRFCAAASAICPRADAWIPEGQNRGGGAPSLNINVDKAAENPAMVGGATVAGADPVPWVAWQEQDGNVAGSGNHPQIFVSRGVKQAAAGQPCAGFKPSANPSVAFFCWQQVGRDRLLKDGGASPTGDPTLNIDPSRNGIEPDDAFTGAGDTVPWVVWYETGPSALGLRGNEQVFAAKAVADPAADGGFHWQAVGNGTATQTDVLDNAPPSGFGACSASVPAEDACSLNKVPSADAEDPRVAAGTLTPGAPTVPWVVWAEATGGGKHAIFISRLVGGTHFELFNGGNPLSNPANDAASPDITFLGNVPYVSWVETVGAATLGFVGHFEGSAFVLDTPGGIRLPAGHGPVPLIDFRVPISSACTADPFTGDGSACPGGAPNAPFFTFTRAGSPQALFAEAAGPCTVIVGCSDAISISGGQALVTAQLGQGAPVGILVQRIVRERKVKGRTVLTLRPVGRVPFGHRAKGRLHVRWNLRVSGRRLRPGRYLVTLRAFTDNRGRVIARAQPIVLRVRR
jgi:hypothetical protein